MRDRRRELPIPARGLLKEACARAGRGPLEISSEAMAVLLQHRWPDNVRELRSLMELLATTVFGTVLLSGHLREHLHGEAAGGATASGRPPGRSLEDDVRELERTRILEVLQAVGHVQVRAAELLQVPERTFRRKLWHGAPVPAVLSLLVLLGLAGVLLGLALPARALVLACKPAASLAFVGLGLLSAGRGPYRRWVLLGLCLGASGDVALLFLGTVSLLPGLILFLLGHVLYCATFASRAPLREFASPAAVPLLLSLCILCWLYPLVPEPLRGPVAAYVAVITVMVAGALAVFRRGGAGRWLLLLGALLSYASDISVALDRFVRPRLLHSLRGLLAYYLAQVLLALSAHLAPAPRRGEPPVAA